MGIMDYLRNRMGKILVIVIGVALFAFIAGEVVQFGGSFFRGDANTIGEVAGKQIAYKDFNENVERTSQQMQQQYGSAMTPQMTGYVQEQVWNQLTSRAILNNELDKVGLVVGTDENKSLISGKNPHPQIVQAFGDPKTGQVDPVRLNQFLKSLETAKADDPTKKQWIEFVEQIVEAKRAEKYVSLISNGLYVNSLEAKDDYEAKNKLVNFKYVALDYASVPDNKITLTDGDYQEYYDEHKSLFKNKQELRSFEYVTFNGAPSKADTAEIKAQVDKLAQDFKASDNDSLFVQLNSENKAPLTYQKKGQLEPAVDSVMFGAEKGFVYGPYLAGDSYKIAKLVDARMSPDSVTASHILINAEQAGGIEKAQAKADSIKKLIEGGRSFAELAGNFSVDKGSAEKGGSVGTFGRGAMVPEFENAAFNGKPGDLKVVASQFGVHLIRIENQKGSSKVVKVAFVDKPVVASSTTQSAAYSKAQAFLGKAEGGDFAGEAKKANAAVMPSGDVAGASANLPGLENPRELVRWAFKDDTEVGDVSDQVFTLGNQFVVARLTSVKPEGQLPLEAVKTQIEAAVRNQVKAKQLTEKLQSAAAGASNIAQVAQKAGGNVAPVQNIVFANPVIPGLGPEYKLVGAAFGSQPGKVSKPVEGQMAVYVFSVDGFVKPPALTNTVKAKEQITQALLQRAQGSAFEALKDKANVKDYRAKFL